MNRIINSLAILLLIGFSAKAQNQLIGSLEYGNRSFYQLDYTTTTVGNKLYIMSQWASFTADLNSGEMNAIQQYFGIKLTPESGPLFLLRSPSGLFKPTESGLELIHALDGEDSFPYSYVGASAGDVSFFKYRDTELWETDGTTEGTVKFREFDHPIQAIALLGDSVHCIIKSSETYHYAIHRVNHGEKSVALPSPIESSRLFSDAFLALKNRNIIDDQYGWYFYSLLDRSIKFVAIPSDTIPMVSPSTMTSINGYLYGSPIWSGFEQYVTPPRKYIYRISIENNGFEMIYTSHDSIPFGNMVVFDVDSQLVILGGSYDTGSELYRKSTTGENVELLKDIYPGWAGSLWNGTFLPEPSGGTTLVFKDKLYFAAKSPYNGAELWRTDGSASGSRRFSDFEPGPGGVHWMGLFSSDGNLYCMTRTRENTLNLYRIDDAAEGYDDEVEPDNDMIWDRYFYREGPSYQDYMNPLREPQLVSTSTGFTGLLPGFRANSTNYTDRFVEVDGDFELEMPDNLWIHDANILYFLNTEGLIDTALFIYAAGAKCTMAVDSETEEIYITFGHEDSTVIGISTIFSPGKATGLAKLSPQGELLWHKLFQKEGGVFIHGMDKISNKLFISGYYTNAALNLGNGITLNSIYNQQYFTAAFDLNGAAIWAVNTSMEGLTSYSTLGQISADESTGRVYVASSEYGLNTSSTCGYSAWKSRVVALDMLSGEEVWSQDFICDDVLRLRDISTDALGNLWLAGNFRGNLTFKNSMLHADGDNNCPTNAFIALLDGKTGSILKSFSSPHINKCSRKILARDGFMDVVYLHAFYEPEDALQPMAFQRISYLEKETYNLTGKWVGTERFPTQMRVLSGRYSNDDDANIKATICAVGESHYALQLAYFGGGYLGLGTRRAPPFRGWKSSTTTIQRRNPDFQLPEDFSDEPYSNVGFSIYPNPVSNGWITLVIDPDRLGDFDTMTFADVSGRMVWKVNLDTRYYTRQYPLPPLEAGMYVVTLRGANDSGSQRLMVLK